MYTKLTGLGKRLAAYFTLVWLLTSVVSVVVFKMTGLGKRLAAYFTLEWLLTSVDSFVLFQIIRRRT